jgi:hypothetical protein
VTTSFGLLIVVGVLVAIFAVGGARSRGARPVGRTGLMSAGRVVLVIVAAVIAYVVWAH